MQEGLLPQAALFRLLDAADVAAPLLPDGALLLLHELALLPRSGARGPPPVAANPTLVQAEVLSRNRASMARKRHRHRHTPSTQGPRSCLAATFEGQIDICKVFTLSHTTTALNALRISGNKQE